jgi:hypothetical protein
MEHSFGNDSSRGDEIRCLGAREAIINGKPIALYFMYYSFARIHQTLRVTPAMEVGSFGSWLELGGNR